MNRLSIIVPCYNESLVLPIFYTRVSDIVKNLDGYELELIFIDDGSTDTTLEIIKAFALRDTRIRFISFSRNFGKEAAILAGLVYSTGNRVAVMDADLQDPPELLPSMLSALDEGFDVAALHRTTRKGEPLLISIFSRLFYRIMNSVSEVRIEPGARDFRVMKQHVVDSIIQLTEYNRFSKGIFSWVGFHTKWIEYENHTRAAGKSKWSFFKLLKYAFDGILSFTTAPLQITLVFGMISSAAGFIYMLYIIFLKLFGGIELPGYPSLMAVILFLGGIQLLAIGIIGQYISKMYIEVKRRPKYIVNEENFSEGTYGGY